MTEQIKESDVRGSFLIGWMFVRFVFLLWPFKRVPAIISVLCQPEGVISVPANVLNLNAFRQK